MPLCTVHAGAQCPAAPAPAHASLHRARRSSMPCSSSSRPCLSAPCTQELNALQLQLPPMPLCTVHAGAQCPAAPAPAHASLHRARRSSMPCSSSSRPCLSAPCTQELNALQLQLPPMPLCTVHAGAQCPAAPAPAHASLHRARRSSMPCSSSSRPCLSAPCTQELNALQLQLPPMPLCTVHAGAQCPAAPAPAHASLHRARRSSMPCSSSSRPCLSAPCTQELNALQLQLPPMPLCTVHAGAQCPAAPAPAHASLHRARRSSMPCSSSSRPCLSAPCTQELNALQLQLPPMPLCTVHAGAQCPAAPAPAHASLHRARRSSMPCSSSSRPCLSAPCTQELNALQLQLPPMPLCTVHAGAQCPAAPAPAHASLHRARRSSMPCSSSSRPCLSAPCTQELNALQLQLPPMPLCTVHAGAQCPAAPAPAHASLHRARRSSMPCSSSSRPCLSAPCTQELNALQLQLPPMPLCTVHAGAQCPAAPAPAHASLHRARRSSMPCSSSSRPCLSAPCTQELNALQLQLPPMPLCTVHAGAQCPAAPAPAHASLHRARRSSMPCSSSSRPCLSAPCTQELNALQLQLPPMPLCTVHAGAQCPAAPAPAHASLHRARRSSMPCSSSSRPCLSAPCTQELNALQLQLPPMPLCTVHAGAQCPAAPAPAHASLHRARRSSMPCSSSSRPCLSAPCTQELNALQLQLPPMPLCTVHAGAQCPAAPAPAHASLHRARRSSMPCSSSSRPCLSAPCTQELNALQLQLPPMPLCTVHAGAQCPAAPAPAHASLHRARRSSMPCSSSSRPCLSAPCTQELNALQLQLPPMPLCTVHAGAQCPAAPAPAHVLSHEGFITNAPNARMPPLIIQRSHRETPWAGVSGTPLAPRPVPVTIDHPPSQPAAGAQPYSRESGAPLSPEVADSNLLRPAMAVGRTTAEDYCSTFIFLTTHHKETTFVSAAVGSLAWQSPLKPVPRSSIRSCIKDLKLKSQKRDYGTRTSEHESEEKSRSGRNTTIVGRRGTERERAKEVAGTAVSELRNDGEHKMAIVRQEHNREPLEGPHQGSARGEPVSKRGGTKTSKMGRWM
ncbi:UNVERIFIED_CONTAM: hypothetical protein FKN15_056338 [Acipenser sinensis]